ncbi:glycerophosphodiester phosphodiesterase [Seongchinamella sediminis]|uniref:Glycerophosphodiester phosphodiesterase n=1 Tax=Seongchinamella sediminis TaxID=2283635 RepID=A0A3L7E1B6_9GAMM|nr:glycerophosphodiester phosphodiesterase family protein [Seongchinamella sediminis]RLQ22655.1 glycerophosphodiester phosphodiesterase [Seongchinamella sediminis]
MKALLQGLAMDLVDAVMALIPRAVPPAAALRSCKIVSHRGEHDNRRVMENTLLAFDNARAAGVWGIECDVRWTRDQVPVICHDASAARVFGRPLLIASLSFRELREQLPAIPSLEEVVARYSGNTHLMLELKCLSPQHLAQQRQTLAAILGKVSAGEDYHVLALDPGLFTLVDFLDPGVLLPVAETNVRTLSELSLQRAYGGLAGHYLLLGEGLRRRHLAAGQHIGTGFPRSRNCLCREINRGVEWVFSNHAVYLQQQVNAMLARHGG